MFAIYKHLTNFSQIFLPDKSNIFLGDKIFI